MWVGQYKCLNPGDLLCNQACPLDATTMAQCGDATAECIDPAGCGLMQYCMPVSTLLPAVHCISFVFPGIDSPH